MKRCEGIDLDPPAPLDLGDPAALLLPHGGVFLLGTLRGSRKRERGVRSGCSGRSGSTSSFATISIPLRICIPASGHSEMRFRSAFRNTWQADDWPADLDGRLPGHRKKARSTRP
jgi:hypothetical protein